MPSRSISGKVDRSMKLLKNLDGYLFLSCMIFNNTSLFKLFTKVVHFNFIFPSWLCFSEKGRWSESVGDFARQMSTVTGDCMLVAAFIAYIGYFDQSYRAMLLEQWQEQVFKASVISLHSL
jgi:hypothetical protein